jgi:hypothetical protein
MNDAADAKSGEGVRAPFRDPKFAAAIDYEPARALYAVWSAAAGAKGVVDKQALMPPHIPARVMQSVFIHEETGGRFRCRLVGSELDHVTGSSGTGKFVDEILSGAALDSRLVLMRRCLDERRAVLFAGKLFAPNRAHVQTRRLLLPMQDNAGTRLVMGVAWFPGGARSDDVFTRTPDAATLVALEDPSQA